MKTQKNNHKLLTKFGEILFKKYELQNEWVSEIPPDNYEISFIISNKINWDLIKQIVEDLIENKKNLAERSESVLVPFHKTIFNNEYQEKDGYFELICVEIKKYDENFNYEINLLFAIHSKTNFVMDPYATYSCVFLKRQYTYVLKKVEREI
ncbi:hypothetical protein [Chryseobacterium sp. EO14]|uniref:hypothetical protein n=1 Tax=unclassified Chryseobacterium TaxID=2593645 RepID=UPI00210EC1EC|nr:hypothetical protein [Chryseobacterium sp. EO14]MCQ4141880.1 hypothetical protein [Chryseobacterium sp. EO14]